MTDVNPIAHRFNTSHAQVVAGNGGLPKLVIAHPRCEGEVYLQGAHVTHWQPPGAEAVIWMSPLSSYAPGKAIRGGVPICFPWFGPKPEDPSAPAHGFLRTRPWELAGVEDDDQGVRVRLKTASDAQTRRQWPAEFQAEYSVHFGSTLHLRLAVRNTGPAPAPVTEALHTYFKVSDVRQISVSGLGGTEYISKVDNGARMRQEMDDITFTGETDRVYVDTAAVCTIRDEQLGRRIVVDKRGSKSTVVWNPFPRRAGELADLGGDHWPGFVCVETANALDNQVAIDPGQTHEIAQIISLQPIENA